MRASASFMHALRNALDEARVERARDEGLITARQAANALKFIRAAKEVCANSIQTSLVRVGTRFVGEVAFDGKVWEGRRYGKDYPRGTSFTSEAEAYDFVARAVEEEAHESLRVADLPAFDPAVFLDSEEAAVAYMTAVWKEGDASLIGSALADVARSPWGQSCRKQSPQGKPNRG